MTEPQDKFWRLVFIALTTVVLFIGVGFVVGFLSSQLPIPSIIKNPASEEPFVARTQVPGLPTATKSNVNYFYLDAIPEGLYDTSWQTEIIWQSIEQVHEGSYAARVVFSEPWSGVSISGETINFTSKQAISLAIFLESPLSELYLELYNSNDGTVGRLALSHYAPIGALEVGSWQVFVIPLADFAPILPDNLAGFGLLTEVSGIIFIDEIRLLP